MFAADTRVAGGALRKRCLGREKALRGDWPGKKEAIERAMHRYRVDCDREGGAGAHAAQERDRES